MFTCGCNTYRNKGFRGQQSTADWPHSSLTDLSRDFSSFIDSYEGSFVTTTRSVARQTQQYLCGLMQTNKSNMERMAEVVPDSDDQVLQHFLTYSPWSHRTVMDQVALDTDSIFGADPDTCMIVDESGIPKKGNKSVGVARQWCGQLGKVDNCQVGVFGALACRDSVTLIDSRLYLPGDWTSDPKRCRAAGIPQDCIVAKSKCDLAFEMITHARSNGIRYHWIGVDGGYGKDPSFLRRMDSAGEIFVADVHKDQQIYLEDPKPIIPMPQSKRGRKPIRRVAQSESHRVDKWTAEQPGDAWKRVTIRQSTQGELTVEILHKRVWLWDGEEDRSHCWHLIVRREIGAREEIKYSLSNASETTSVQRLAFMQGQRYWVERALQDGKSEAGLGDYQVRKWNSWHHHMALVMMAMLFMLKTRSHNKDAYPLLSCSDIKVMLAYFLPRRNTTLEEILHQMQIRHNKRQASIDCASRKAQRYITSRGG